MIYNFSMDYKETPIRKVSKKRALYHDLSLEFVLKCWVQIAETAIFCYIVICRSICCLIFRTSFGLNFVFSTTTFGPKWWPFLGSEYKWLIIKVDGGRLILRCFQDWLHIWKDWLRVRISPKVDYRGFLLVMLPKFPLLNLVYTCFVLFLFCLFVKQFR